MDPRKNPYAPGAGTKPPALVGRDGEIDTFEILLERLERGYAEQSMIVTGLRGVGKTVLLDVFREKAEARDWAAIEWEIEKNAPFAPRLAAHVRRALLQLASKARWTKRIRRAASVLKSFSLTFTTEGSIAAGLDVEALAGVADSGALADDLVLSRLPSRVRPHRLGRDRCLTRHAQRRGDCPAAGRGKAR
jgi:hypothetical protein